MPQRKQTSPKGKAAACSLRFEATRLDSLFEVLDALAWLNLPNVSEVSQFAGIDPRTGGKLLKNSLTIGLVESVANEKYSLSAAYPHKGSLDQKRAVVREALVRMPLLKNVRQFLKLSESLDNSLRKAAAVQKVENFEPGALTPLLDWAKQLNALDPSLDIEELLDKAEVAKEQRHTTDAQKRIVFLSHSSKDKPTIRQLATDLTAAGVTVWLDEQKIHVGDSIPEGIAQGLAESDFFLIALSEHSTSSAWVKRELNSALIDAISKRKVKILPVLLSVTEIPVVIRDMKYADFTKSYKQGLNELLTAIQARRDDGRS
jgi:hypothetical protein